MPITNYDEFHCPLCGYITRNENQVEQFRKTGICPACQNGKNKGWHSTGKPAHLNFKGG